MATITSLTTELTKVNQGIAQIHLALEESIYSLLADFDKSDDIHIEPTYKFNYDYTEFQMNVTVKGIGWGADIPKAIKVMEDAGFACEGIEDGDGYSESYFSIEGGVSL